MGSVTPEMVDGAVLGGDLDLDLEGDFAVVVDGGRHVDVDADVEVGELGLDADRADAGGDAGGVAAGGDGDPGADLEGGALAVGGADAGVLQDAGVGVGEQRVDGAAGDCDGEVGGVEVGEGVEGEVRGGGRGARGGTGGGAVAGGGARAGAGAGGAGGRQAEGLGEGDAEIADLVAVDLKHGDVDDDLGLGAVEVVEELLREQELIGGGAQDDGVLGGDESQTWRWGRADCGAQ